MRSVVELLKPTIGKIVLTTIFYLSIVSPLFVLGSCTPLRVFNHGEAPYNYLPCGRISEVLGRQPFSEIKVSPYHYFAIFSIVYIASCVVRKKR